MDIGISAGNRSGGWPSWTRQAKLAGSPLRRAITGVRARSRRHGAARRLPDFLILGAQRAGTTSLYNYLLLHPQVVEPLAKELNYLSLHWSRGERWYRSHFPVAGPEDSGEQAGRSLTFEASPYYLFHPHAPERAGRIIPDAKMIVLLRHPAERAFSHHQHNARRGLERLPFAEAIACEDERLAGEVERMEADPTYQSRAHRLYSYAARGRYADQLERWYRHFPTDRVLVLRSEDLYADPATVLGDVVGFLGLDPWRPPAGLANFSRSRAGDGSALPLDIRAGLVHSFATDNARLAGLLGRDFSAWER